jgi:uncharacterized membrane protein
MRTWGKLLILACAGGLVYGGIELLWRGYTHWTMLVLGGLLFVVVGALNEYIPWEMPLCWQGILGAALVTVCELLAGLLLNVWLGWAVWDYADMPYNLWGQICLPYALLWIPLAVVAIILDDWLRYWLWHEDRPRYTVF